MVVLANVESLPNMAMSADFRPSPRKSFGVPFHAGFRAFKGCRIHLLVVSLRGRTPSNVLQHEAVEPHHDAGRAGPSP